MGMGRTTELVGFDLDDVLMDFNSGLCIFHNTWYGTSLTRDDIISYHLEDIWRCNREECVRRVGEFYLSREHEEMRPVLGASEVVQELQDNGAGVVVVTSRPESAAAPTRLLLEKHFPTLVDSVHFANHFFHEEVKVTKGEICQKLGVEIFADDAPFHSEDVALVTRASLLFDAPWNRDYSLFLPNMQRVYSWSEIRQVLNT